MNFTTHLYIVHCYRRAFHSFAESPKLHNSHFMGHTRIGVLFLREQGKHGTKCTQVVLFHFLYANVLPALSDFSLLKKKD